MTGFGIAAKSWPEVEIAAELRSVNSRYLDLRMRLPREAQSLEAPIRDRIQSQLARGRVELALTFELRSEDQLQLNESLLRSYQLAANRAAELGVAGSLTVEQLLQIPGILKPGELRLTPAQLEEKVLEVVDEVLEKLIEARRSEGGALRQDVSGRLVKMEELVQKIQDLSGDLTQIYRERLEKKIAGLRHESSVDEGRLAQEVCYYAERADVSEELIRLSTHLARFRVLLNAVDGVPVGRNLDFLCQEMNREINTIGSKAGKPDIAELSIEGKVEAEKIREQVQNIE